MPETQAIPNLDKCVRASALPGLLKLLFGAHQVRPAHHHLYLRISVSGHRTVESSTN